MVETLIDGVSGKSGASGVARLVKNSAASRFVHDFHLVGPFPALDMHMLVCFGWAGSLQVLYLAVAPKGSPVNLTPAEGSVWPCWWGLGVS